MDASDLTSVSAFVSRLELLLECIGGVEVLLETQDGSLADDPALVAQIVRDLAHPRLGLLFQPTFFHDPERIRQQFRIQKPYIRHLHLQNRTSDFSLVRLKEGITPWPELLTQLDPSIDASLEFVPVGICPPEQFDLEAAMNEARLEADYVRELLKRGISRSGRG